MSADDLLREMRKAFPPPAQENGFNIGAKLSNGTARNGLLLLLTVITGANFFAPQKVQPTLNPSVTSKEVVTELQQLRGELQEIREGQKHAAESQLQQIRQNSQLIELLRRQPRARVVKSPEEINQLRAKQLKEKLGSTRIPDYSRNFPVHTQMP
jgi:hypothetical protein